MKRHIIVTEYNTAWPALFETETEKIQTILGETLVAVHHIGSTSVKGMKAKPTIDIMPVVHEIGTADPHKREFEAIGYEYLGEYGIPGRRYLRKVWGEKATGKTLCAIWRCGIIFARIRRLQMPMEN